MPSAAPRTAGGAVRETRLGWLASSALKPQKNRNSSPPRAHSPGGVPAEAVQPSPSLHQQYEADGTQQGAAQPAGAFQGEQAAHGQEGQHHGGQVEVPVRALGQPGLHQQRGHGHPHGQLHRVQREDAEVEAQQVGVAQHVGQAAARRVRVACGLGGTTQSTTAMPASASAQVSPKMPGRPKRAASGGAATSATANISPMLPPTRAMALVRTPSRVWSASRAVTAAETAPAPCSARPSSSPPSESASAASRLPAANTSRPSTMTRLRPKRSEAMPSGSCSTAWVSP